jgi:polyisoprenoid-binding protein YceI
MTEARTTNQVETRAGARTVWEIDSKHTALEFAVKHMMFATVKGRFAGVKGTIEIDERDPTRASVEVEIDARTIDTREEQRDAHLRSADFFDVDRYPTIRFRSVRVERIGEKQARVNGDLTIRDVTRPVVLDATFLGRGTNPWGQEVAGFHAETTINRKDFGLHWNAPLEAGGFLVGDEIKVEADVEAIRKA